MKLASVVVGAAVSAALFTVYGAIAPALVLGGLVIGYLAGWADGDRAGWERHAREFDATYAGSDPSGLLD